MNAKGKALKSKAFSNERSSSHVENEEYKAIYPSKARAIKKHRFEGMNHGGHTDFAHRMANK